MPPRHDVRVEHQLCLPVQIERRARHHRPTANCVLYLDFLASIAAHARNDVARSSCASGAWSMLSRRTARSPPLKTDDLPIKRGLSGKSTSPDVSNGRRPTYKSDFGTWPQDHRRCGTTKLLAAHSPAYRSPLDLADAVSWESTRELIDHPDGENGGLRSTTLSITTRSPSVAQSHNVMLSPAPPEGSTKAR